MWLFWENRHFIFFSACRTVDVSIVFVLLLVCSTRIDVDKQTHTHRPSTVTLAVHARQGLIIHMARVQEGSHEHSEVKCFLGEIV